MRRTLVLATAFVLGACGGNDAADDDVAGPDAADSAAVTMQFVSPLPGATFAQAQLAASGFLVADVPVELAITGAPARIVVTRDQAIIGELSASGVGVAEVPGNGPVELVAIAYDASGAPVASAEVAIALTAPAVDDCHAWLDLYQLDYVTGPNNPGVADPITVTTPINGMAWRYVDNDNPRTTLFGGCELIRSLAQAAPYLRQRDIVEVADIGVYNYRCIGGLGEPPNCPNGISQHAYANAIDIAGVTTSDGSYASVLTDFVIDGNDEEICDAATEPGPDTLLHELICELKAADVWNIVLTPNYNTDHRNHFHVDLTPGADTIHREVEHADADAAGFNDRFTSELPAVAACQD